MSLIPWKHRESAPARGELAPWASLRYEMDRLFDSFLREPFGWSESALVASASWLPTVDVSEGEGEVVVRSEIPGVKPEDLDISVAGNVLTLAGEKKEEHEKKGKDFHQVESRFGSFRRQVQLPADVETDDVQADYANGVLTVRLRKTERGQPKKIAVSSS